MARDKWQLDVILPSTKACDVVKFYVDLKMANVADLGVATCK